MDINTEKLLLILKEFSKIGKSGEGITRKGFSHEEREAHRLAGEYMKQAGLSVRVDEAGNTIGRWGKVGEAALVVGSHLDSVPKGGAFDGAFGVAAGIVCAETIISSNETLPWAIEVIAFSDEEGAYHAGTLGSRAMMGRLSERELTEEIDGVPNPLALAMERAGLKISLLPNARRRPKEFIAYLELHVEQGPVLEKMGKQIGIVTGIPSLSRYLINFDGSSAHSGTTPLSMRDDALRKAALFLDKGYQILFQKEGRVIGNFGNIRVEPGTFNVVPGRAILSLELRSIDIESIEELEGIFREILYFIDSRATIEEVLKKGGSLMDKRIIDVILSSCKHLGYGYFMMPSGAGHDATSFAPDVPSGMIFVPSVGGKSHSPDEYTPPEAMAAGVKTLLTTILDLKNIISYREEADV